MIFNPYSLTLTLIRKSFRDVCISTGTNMYFVSCISWNYRSIFCWLFCWWSNSFTTRTFKQVFFFFFFFFEKKINFHSFCFVLVDHYTEKLILLPPPYQVNTFDESTPFPTRHHIHVDKNWMWKDHLSQLDNYLKRSILFGDSDVGINGPFVFCNFNNAHKLDPGSFSIWMNILRRVNKMNALDEWKSQIFLNVFPNSNSFFFFWLKDPLKMIWKCFLPFFFKVPDSVLWILVDQFDERAKYIMKNLHKEAIFHGIAPSRILTASKWLIFLLQCDFLWFSLIFFNVKLGWIIQITFSAFAELTYFSTHS